MSLIRQLWLLLLATVLVAVAGSVLVTVGAARGYLETQLRLKNSDNAQALALALSQQGGDAALAEVLIAAQFDTGFYERIVLATPDGRVLAERRTAPRVSGAPGWFVRAVPIDSTPGVAQVSDGWRALGTLEVVSAAGFAHADLWRSSLRSAAWLALVGLLAAALAAAVLRRIRRPLQATVEQAQALVERRFVIAAEPRVPELRQLSRAMNAMVQRLQAVFGEQGAQLELLRREAQADALTGLAHRAHFMAALASLRQREDAPAHGALLLLRVRDLAGLNRELGHAATDALLCTLAQALRALPAAQAEAAQAGRLNGCDFALLVPHAEPASAAEELQRGVKAAMAAWPTASTAIGAVYWQPALAVPALLQSADAALVHAEAQASFGQAIGLAVGLAPAADAPLLGEGEWRRRLLRALEQGDAVLGSYPVVARDGRVLHLEAPLRLRLQEGGALEPAACWLPWALRAQLSARADLLAVRLALGEIARDGQARGVNLAPASLADSSFVAQLRAMLQAQPQAAGALWLEVGEQAAIEQLALLGELGRQVRPLGVRLGLEHAGERLARIASLYEAGLDYVKLDAALTLGMAHSPQRTDFVRGLVWMLHGLGMQVHAEGVREAADADALWVCGVDGQTGPWVSAQPG